MMANKRDLMGSASAFHGPSKGMGYKAHIADKDFNPHAEMREGDPTTHVPGDEMLIHLDADGVPKIVSLDDRVDISSGNERFVRTPAIRLEHITTPLTPGPFTIERVASEFMEHPQHGRIGTLRLLDADDAVIGDTTLLFPSPGEALAAEAVFREALEMRRRNDPRLHPQSNVDFLAVAQGAADDAWYRAGRAAPDIDRLLPHAPPQGIAADNNYRLALLIGLFVERVAG